MKSKILGFTLLFGLAIQLNASEPFKLKIGPEYMGSIEFAYLSIQAKDDIELDQIEINRGKCKAYVTRPAWTNREINEYIQETKKGGKQTVIEYGNILKVYPMCKYDEILEVKIKTNKGEFVFDEFGLDF
ncbi:hypothetical protein OFO01_08630 [Campylobacter sp. JMF_01 NE2]|uniref:hypothetical protein n=1 Tax=unclassified Campylobacter TaxID=2593542 RepID=UPI0022E9E051|nr:MULTISPECIES: hypothetical protein [unclassified Campylobacter]MDA3053658.1 hypothetical protein [Campylobacter sp. JMF_03 NE3]MDA3067846.1 hypothetical protein [Campylobacter sp. JMF_01 NE2]